MENILVIAPHVDDEVLGVGGTIYKHTTKGDHVNVIVITDRAGGTWRTPFSAPAQTQRDQCLDVCVNKLKCRGVHFLGLADGDLDRHIIETIEPLETVYTELQPDIVYMPFFGDYNLDHQCVFKAASIVARRYRDKPPKQVYMYEIPSSTTQSARHQFNPNTYSVLTEQQIEVKIEAMLLYHEEVKEGIHPRNRDGLTTYARMRGLECGHKYAEAFHLLYNIT